MTSNTAQGSQDLLSPVLSHRAAAKLVDWVLLDLVTCLLVFLISFLLFQLRLLKVLPALSSEFGPPSAFDGLSPAVLQAVLVGVRLSLSFFYHIGFVYFFGTTLGKSLFKISVVSQLGDDLTLQQSFLRHFFSYFSFIFLGLGYLIVLVHPKKTAWHDLLSQTQLVSLKKLIRI
ncbi:MAG: RDD family protein [Bdellovibrionia bacterium]